MFDSWICFFSGLFCDDGKLVKMLDADYKRLFPFIFSYQHWLKNDDVVRVTESLRRFYFGDRKISLDTVNDLVNVSIFVNFIN